jgi:hypothetical protein
MNAASRIGNGESMSNRPNGSGSDEAAMALIVHIEGQFAGLAVREGRGFRFLSAHPGFDLLDGSRFTRPEEIKRAARNLVRAARG